MKILLKKGFVLQIFLFLIFLVTNGTAIPERYADKEISFFDDNSYYNNITVAGNYIYCLESSGNVRQYDLSNVSGITSKLFNTRYPYGTTLRSIPSGYAVNTASNNIDILDSESTLIYNVPGSKNWWTSRNNQILADGIVIISSENFGNSYLSKFVRLDTSLQQVAVYKASSDKEYFQFVDSERLAVTTDTTLKIIKSSDLTIEKTYPLPLLPDGNYAKVAILNGQLIIGSRVTYYQLNMSDANAVWEDMQPPPSDIDYVLTNSQGLWFVSSANNRQYRYSLDTNHKCVRTHEFIAFPENHSPTLKHYLLGSSLLSIENDIYSQKGNIRAQIFDPTVTIPYVNVIVNNATTKESEKQFRITVELDEPASSTTSVRFRTTDGTATPSVDYMPQDYTVTFLKGEKHKHIIIPILQDQVLESDETIGYTISDYVNCRANPSTEKQATYLTIKGGILDNGITANTIDLKTNEGKNIHVLKAEGDYIFAQYDKASNIDYSILHYIGVFDKNNGSYLYTLDNSYIGNDYSVAGNISNIVQNGDRLCAVMMKNLTNTYIEWDAKNGKMTKQYSFSSSIYEYGQLKHLTGTKWIAIERIIDTTSYVPRSDVKIIDFAGSQEVVQILKVPNIDITWGEKVIAVSGNSFVIKQTYQFTNYAGVAYSGNNLIAGNINDLTTFSVIAIPKIHTFWNIAIVGNNILGWNYQKIYCYDISLKTLKWMTNNVTDAGFASDGVNFMLGKYIYSLDNGYILNSISDDFTQIGNMHIFFAPYYPSRYYTIQILPSDTPKHKMSLSSHIISPGKILIRVSSDEISDLIPLNFKYRLDLNFSDPLVEQDLQVPADSLTHEILLTYDTDKFPIYQIDTSYSHPALIVDPMSSQRGIHISAPHEYIEKFPAIFANNSADISKATSLYVVGDYLLVGSPGWQNEKYEEVGRVDVYDLKNNAYIGQIIPQDTIAYKGFGASFAHNGNKLLIGAFGGIQENYKKIKPTGVVYVFDISNWEQIKTIRNTTKSARFGSCIAANDTYFAIGAPGEHFAVKDKILPRKTSLVVYKWSNFKPIKTIKKTGAAYASNLAIVGDTLFVAATDQPVKIAKKIIPNAGVIYTYKFPKVKNSMVLGSADTHENEFLGNYMQVYQDQLLLPLGKELVTAYSTIDNPKQYKLPLSQWSTGSYENGTFVSKTRNHDISIFVNQQALSLPGMYFHITNLDNMSLDAWSSPSTLINPNGSMIFDATSYHESVYFLTKNGLFVKKINQLGGYKNWAIHNLPIADFSGKTDSNQNGIIDIEDYMIAKTGPINPVSIAYNSNNTTYKLYTSQVVPNDVLAEISVSVNGGDWKKIAYKIGSRAWSDLETQNSWNYQIDYNAQVALSNSKDMRYYSGDDVKVKMDFIYVGLH